MKPGYAYANKKLLFNKNIMPRGVSLEDEKVFKKMLARVKMNEATRGNKFNVGKVMKNRQHKMFKLTELGKKRMQKLKQDELDRMESDQKITLSNKGRFYDFMTYYAQVQKDTLYDKSNTSKMKIFERIKNLKHTEDERTKNLNKYIISQLVKDCQLRIFGSRALNMIKAQEMIFDPKGSEKILQESLSILRVIEMEEEKERFVQLFLAKKKEKEEKEKKKLPKLQRNKYKSVEISQKTLREIVQNLEKKHKFRRKYYSGDFTVEEIINDKIPKLHTRLTSAVNNRIQSATTQQLEKTGLLDQDKMMEFYKFLKNQNRKSRRRRINMIKNFDKIQNGLVSHIKKYSSAPKIRLRKVPTSKSMIFSPRKTPNKEFQRQGTLSPTKISKTRSVIDMKDSSLPPILKNKNIPKELEITSPRDEDTLSIYNDVYSPIPSPLLKRVKKKTKRRRGIAKRCLIEIKCRKNIEMKKKNDELIKTKFMKFFNSISQV